MPELPPDLMAVFEALGTIVWIIPLVAIVEIAGGILVAIPKYRALGAIVILPVMVGIVVHHATHDLAGIGVGLVLFLINVFIIIEHRDQYLPLIK
ncbi:MAG: DoxX family protein [Balneolaceae bacterium]